MSLENKVPRIILGTWQNFMPSVSSFDQQKEMLRLALENGIHEIDTSNNYGYGAVENQLGLLLQDFSESDFKVSTKVYFPMSETAAAEGLSRASIHKNIAQSLHRLGRKGVDRYICHRWDLQTPLEETIVAMNDLVTAGKIREWGISQWSLAQIQECHAICSQKGLLPPKSDQILYNLLQRNPFESELKVPLNKMNVEVHSYSPLAQGFLTGKYLHNGTQGRLTSPENQMMKNRYFTSENFQKLQKFSELATEYELTLTQIALRWIFQSQVQAVVVGASSCEQLTLIIAESKQRLDPQLKVELEILFA